MLSEEKKKTGLVLEGGAMRGIYTAGVLDVLMENNIIFDGVIGVSAGAIHGSSYVSGQHGRSIRYYKKYCRNKHFMSMWSLLTTGSIVGEKFCYDELPNVLDPFDFEAFKKSPMEFYAVCTNVETGKAEYIRCYDMREDMDYMRASASMPFVSKIVTKGGKKLLDGGVADSIPVEAFKKMGFQKMLVVLTQVKDYKKPPHKVSFLNSLQYHRYPELLKSVAGRHLVYNRSRKLIDKMERAGEVLALYPSEDLHIGRMEKDPDRIQMMYDLGREDTEKRLDEIKRFLEKE